MNTDTDPENLDDLLGAGVSVKSTSQHVNPESLHLTK